VLASGINPLAISGWPAGWKAGVKAPLRGNSPPTPLSIATVTIPELSYENIPKPPDTPGVLNALNPN
jgi:hypothetical protein